jgi:hypothetical protein
MIYASHASEWSNRLLTDTGRVQLPGGVLEHEQQFKIKPFKFKKSVLLRRCHIMALCILGKNDNRVRFPASALWLEVGYEKTI